MELQLDVIAVLLVFVGFCVGSVLLIKKANEEVQKQQKLENDKLVNNNKNK